MDGRRQAIMTQLNLIDERLKDVNRNSSEIESRIYQILREALFQLQQETQKKVFFVFPHISSRNLTWCIACSFAGRRVRVAQTARTDRMVGKFPSFPDSGTATC